MRVAAILLILLILLPLAAWKSDAQDAPNSMGATEQPTVNSTVINAGVETPTIGNLEVTETSPTAEPTDVPPDSITLTPTETLSPQETVSPELEGTVSPSDVVPSITPSSTVQMGETQPVEVTVDMVPVAGITATDIEMAEITATSQPTPISLTCELDVDKNGVVTDSDLSEIGQKLLNSAVNETTSIYDLNENHLIDIGDLQKMASYLFATCPN